jgi:hypothetical protein
MATSPALAMPPDPLLLLVQSGGLPQAALTRPDGALTRGELYRMAFATLADGRAVPARWTALRARLLKESTALPAGAQPPFAATKLPRRETDAQSPASLSELRAVMNALDLARAARPRLARARPGAPSRADLETAFPQGLAAYESADALADAAPLARATVGPPAISHRQASLLLAYVAGGGAAGSGITSAESR